LGVTAAMHDRAAAIRGRHTYPAIPPAQPRRYGLADALHLAAALEAGCDVFLTNDNQLAGFPDITVEELP
jgi:predicted nucleic acid-binding protein